MGLKDGRFLEKIFSAFCSALPAAIINLIAGSWWNSYHPEEQQWSTEFIFFIAMLEIICVLIAYAILYHILPHFKFMRQFGKYEGRWIEIIPNYCDGRNYSIIDLTFNKKEFKYQLNGFNFSKDFKKGVSFEAYKFVESSNKNGFYYITNHTAEHKNGLGKISFIKPGPDTLTRAEGYFFDSSFNACSRKYEVMLIKCDKKFANKYTPEYTHKQLAKIDPKTIFEHCGNLLEEEKDGYFNHNNSQNMPCVNTSTSE